MRAVVDTNILVRALIRPQGTVGPVLIRLRQGHYTLLYAPPLLEEVVDVLNRPRLRHKYGLTGDDIRTVVSLLLLRGEAVTPAEQITACRDPRDNKFLEIAIAGKADVIVSGDEDLLVLHPFRNIPIVTPVRFLAMLDAENAATESDPEAKRTD
jgi:putative PIN family toxin of toxin-antitoxin system